jgi:hypothetical protein
MSKGVMTCLPPHDGHPGVEITWAADCSVAFNQGAKLAQCSGQAIPDSGLRFSSATAGGSPSLN